VTGAGFCDRLIERASRAGLALTSDEVGPLEAYFGLLQTWNRTINLTSLPLEPVSDEALDRLFVEPLVAGEYLSELRGGGQAGVRLGSDPNQAARWIDLGSGGGSPAIPLKIAVPTLGLVMIEAKSRKVSFLREVVRTLNLRHVTVINARFEEVTDREGTADLVTARAVRADDVLGTTAAVLLKDDGWLMLFGATAEPKALRSFSPIGRRTLRTARMSYLHIYSRVPRGTNPLTQI
jgi:16S rRNA (guanine527-N7)-methyltransferase